MASHQCRPDTRALRPRGCVKVSLVWRLLAGIAIGIGLGLVLKERAEILGELGTLIVRALKTLATPLVFVAIVDSFCRAEIPARKGLLLLLICSVNAAVAGVVAMLLSSLIAPGKHVRVEDVGQLFGAAPHENAPKMDVLGTVKGLVPESVVDPLLKNNVLAVVLLAIIVGIALRRMRREGHGEAIARIVDDAFRLLTTILEWLIQVVPLAVLGVVAKVVGTTGFSVFAALGLLVLTVATGLVVHVFGYYGWVAVAIARVPWMRFFRAALEPIVTALGTGSSMATLPVTLRTLEHKLRVSHESARLAACVGTNFNNDGIMLYEVVAALFVADLAGIHLTWAGKISLCVTSALAAAGIAGVPEAGLITLSLVLSSVGLPLGALPVLLTVDWFLGRLRAATNVSSDLLVAATLDRVGAIRPR